MQDLDQDNKNQIALPERLEFEREFILSELERGIEEEKNNLEYRNSLIGFLFTALSILFAIVGYLLQELIKSPATVNYGYTIVILFFVSLGGLTISVVTFLRGLTNISKVGYSLVRIWLAHHYLKKHIINIKFIIPHNRVLGEVESVEIQANSFTKPMSLAMFCFSIFIGLLGTITIWLAIEVAIPVLSLFNIYIYNGLLLTHRLVIGIPITLIIATPFWKRYSGQRSKMKEYLSGISKRFD
jgi:hypothetical protein